MDLRKKTVIILLTTIWCLILVLLVLSEVVVLEGFSHVEMQSAEKDTNRILVALADDLNTLDAVAYDWASQDSTRTFLIENNSIKSWALLDPDTFERLEFNYIVLANAQGTIVAGKGYDLGAHSEIVVPAQFGTLLVTDQRISRQAKSGSGTMGILRYPEGPLMIAIRPVFSKTDQHRPIGYLMMARYLDAREVSRLSSMAQLPLEILPYHAAALPDDFRKVTTQFPQADTPFIQREGKEALAINAPIIIEPLDSTTLGTYSLIRDLSGQPILVMKVSIVRDIYEQGKSTTLYFIMLLTIAGLAFGLITLFLLEKTVISRILYLSHRANRIGNERDFSARVELSGKDEIEGLAANVNKMLGELEISQQQLNSRLVMSEEKYRLIFNSISDPVIICQFDTIGRSGGIIEVNDAALTALGYTREELFTLSPAQVFMAGEGKAPVDLDSLSPSERGIQFESVFRKKSGDEIPIEVNARIFDPFGQKAVLTISRDIADRKMAEEALRQANKKLNLLNFVTFNDIQNALFVITGYRNLVKEHLHDEKIQGYLQKEEESINKISRSLRFAKSYQDLGIKQPRWQNVNQVFVLAISHLDLSGISRTTPLEGLEIFADPLLETVFFHLADNVLRHGTTATKITFSPCEAPDGLTLIFEDNGKGIPPELKGRIFERASVERNAMGLFLAREILEITGISIVETGVYGEGARFEIRVPKKSYRFSAKIG